MSGPRLLPQESDVVFAALFGRLADHRGVRGLHDGDQQLGVYLPGAEVGVPVTARAGGVFAVHQVDAAGDGLDPVDGVDEPFAGGPGVPGVQAEADPGVADVVPQPGDGVEMAGHRV